jgi:hypothetical protein
MYLLFGYVESVKLLFAADDDPFSALDTEIVKNSPK